MSRQHHCLVVLLLIAFPMSSVVPGEDIAGTTYDETESAPYDITPPLALNSPQLCHSESGLRADMCSARAPVTLVSNFCRTCKGRSTCNLLSDKFPVSRPPLRG